METTIAYFEKVCRENPYLRVKFSPVDCGSWRGVYAEACIFVDLEREDILASFIPFLERLQNEEFYGWKGGEYSYNRRTPLNFETAPREWSNGANFGEMLHQNPEFKKVFLSSKCEL